ncbi:cysteine-rich secretory protein-related [Holotrichia oblita]|uniref:Cysteine-rich secretory protein-related n=1 Tax=Holotrichia oblita TaxID=644536 RepID=A0ACB9TZ55_HOLOL|nr:cysteine-rich secretory protein-related [Holotrichia oblita]
MVFIHHAHSCINENLEVYGKQQLYCNIIHIILISSFLERGVTEEDIITILTEHNRYRQNIMDGVVPGQPRGVGLNYLRWDEELAKAAQESANTCIFKHTTYVDNRWRHKCGQNIYRGEAAYLGMDNKSGYNWTRAVEFWYLEVENYTFGPIKNEDYNITGHYTQLVWGDTYLIGCGFISFDNEDMFRTRNDIVHLHVCNYGPP